MTTTDRALTIAEAIDFLGVADKTVRRMIDAGELVEHERDSRGRIYLTPASLNAAAERLAHQRGDTERESSIVLASQAAIMDRALERHSVIVQEQHERIIALTEEVTTLRTEHQYMVSHDQRIAYERRIAELEALLQAEREQQAKPGWWARLFGQGPGSRPGD